MANFLIRRLAAMIVMFLIITFVAYNVLSLAPGGPLQELQQQQQNNANRLDPFAIERVMVRYEFDIDLIPRYTRWLVGQPNGPLNLFGQEMFGATQVGCLRKGQTIFKYPDGREVVSDCEVPVYLNDLKGRAVSKGILALDFGTSQGVLRGRPVSEVLNSRIGLTLLLQGISSLLALAIAVPLGIYTAVKQYSKLDYATTTVAFLGSSLPSLFWGLMGLLIFAVLFKQWGLPYFPAGTFVSNTPQTVPLIGVIEPESFGDRAWHLILPILILTFVSLSGWIRYIRASVLEVLKQDYVRTARAKGLTERAVILKHAVRNALIPFITLVVTILPGLVAGAIITETIFSLPGVGNLLVAAIYGSDYNVAMAVLLLSVVLTLIAYVLADILYTVADPRIRLR